MATVIYKKPFLYVVTRDRWKALPPVKIDPLQHPVERILILYTDHDECLNKRECKATMRQMQKEAFDQGQPDIMYNFCIGGDSRVYEGRGWRTKVERPDRTDWRDGALVLGYIGKKFMDDDMSEVLIRKGYKFLNYGVQKRYLMSHVKVHDEKCILVV